MGISSLPRWHNFPVMTGRLPGATRVAAAARTARRHWLCCLALAGGAVIRVLTMLAFPPVIWFGGDSASYLGTGLHLVPDKSRVGGYGVLLAVLRPLHSLVAVSAVQHLAGLAVALLIYLLARRYRLPAWAGALAMLPVLFGAYQLQLEADVVPDVGFEFLVVLALALVLWRPRRPRAAWLTAGAAFLLAVAGTFWPVGFVLLVLLGLWLLVRWVTRRIGWQALAAAVLAGALPVAAYLAWFDAAYHQVALSDSTGPFLWARTMSFADCNVIKPPADERTLCPPPPLTHRLASSSYVWIPNSPLLNMPGGRFSPTTDGLAENFALRAIAAQPGGYVTATLHDFALSFTWNRPDHPSTNIVDRYQFADATKLWVSNNLRTTGGGTVLADQRAYTGGRDGATRAVQPFASWMVTYQRYVYLRGTLLALILLAGLAGITVGAFRSERARAPGSDRRRRRFHPAALPWLVAVVDLLAPPAITDFDLRYVVPAIPIACLAAVLAFAPDTFRRRATVAQGSAGTTTSDPRDAQRTWTTSPAATVTRVDPAGGDPSGTDTTSRPS